MEKIKLRVVLLGMLIALMAACGGGEQAIAPTQAPSAVPLEPIAGPTARPTTPEAMAVVLPTAVQFDLGDTVLVQADDVPEDVREMPIRLDGLIAVPPTGDSLPIAIAIHGSHGSGCPSPDGMTEDWPCPGEENRHYQGFAYLIEAMAAQGYVAVSINANPAYVMAYGEAQPNMRLPLLFDQYLEQVAAAVSGQDVAFGVDLKGRVDWDRLVTIGHSQGGEGVNWIADSRVGHTSPEQISAGQGPIAAAIMLAASAISTPEMEMDLPFAVVLPACDRDVASLDGQVYYERARMKPQLDALATSVYLVGANHNRFNSTLEDDSIANVSVVCTGDALLSAETQQGFLMYYVPRFFDAVLGDGDGDKAVLGIDPTQPAPATLFGHEVLTSLTLSTARRLQLPLEPEDATGSARAVFCPQGYAVPEGKTEPCRRLQYNQPAYPEALALLWDGADGAYEVALQEGNRDLSEYGMLHLRVAVDPVSEFNAEGQPQSFSLRLTDGRGDTAVVTLTDAPALVFPAGEKGFDDYYELDTWDNHVILSSVRVPLTAFSGVDLSDIHSVATVFDVSDSGAIFLTDLELLQTNQMPGTAVDQGIRDAANGLYGHLPEQQPRLLGKGTK